MSAEGDGYLVLESNPNDSRDQPQLPDSTLSQGAGLEVTAPNATSGSIDAGVGSPDDVSIGDGMAPDGVLNVTGNVTLGSLAGLDLFLDQPASTVTGTGPSLDYSQMNVSVTVDLGQANLNLYLGTSSTSDCRDLIPGQTYTLISAGTLNGELDDNGTLIANGETIPLLERLQRRDLYADSDDHLRDVVDPRDSDGDRGVGRSCWRPAGAERELTNHL